ncbi:hypothetical protein CLU79DRAFT_741140 [Phycomyces nitens]|nr:hypothetical protein CLU79DRAFT_741140 [Phycomyces nitens]
MSRSDSDSDVATSLLGTYMLQGWVLTDELCQQSGCSVPMMRSKDGLIKFCVSHDSLPTSSASQRRPTTATAITTTTPPPVASPPKASAPRTEDIKSMDKMREQSERREQSSKASQLIGQKLLQRWTLLNDICPNSSCYAVPLMRNPVNKHMVCVICDQTYVTEEDASAMNLTEKPASAPKSKPASETDVKSVSVSNSVSNSDSDSDSDSELELDAEVDMSKTTETRSFRFEDAPEEAAKENPANIDTQRTQHTSKPLSPKLNCTDSAQKNDFEKEYFGQNGIVQMLSSKLSKMTDAAMECNDSAKAIDMFGAIAACAKAVEACVQAGEACSGVVKRRK